ncbi:hypothetical protein RFI_25597 [Reticulomyxa filosa]|uniref:Nucleolar protein 58/56 N-terminal domain-containing protein n=1 Tax=Reticulomyxa filosa TaxID=46433 RepID=X6MEC3_RETFI|nr:hypothetical protein RFI_25597 [Reticulomyxa filosa]|eukprot:ETO11777.1 hypothetical protein RFI_25597 [Reticulomyxa filosa]
MYFLFNNFLVTPQKINAFDLYSIDSTLTKFGLQKIFTTFNVENFICNRKKMKNKLLKRNRKINKSSPDIGAMLILFETASGYALFKVLDEAKIENADDIIEELKDEENRANIIQLHKFKSFENLEEAAQAVECLQESNELHKSLSKFIKKEVVKRGSNETLAVIDNKLGNLIKEKFNLKLSRKRAKKKIFPPNKTRLTILLRNNDKDSININKQKKKKK